MGNAAGGPTQDTKGAKQEADSQGKGEAFVERVIDSSLTNQASKPSGKEISIAEGFQKLKAREIESVSDQKAKIYNDGSSGFVHAVYDAFNNHTPLCFGPDDIWTLIIQGVSKHIELNAEQLRSKFVDFDGKKVLRIFRDQFVKGDPNNDWAGCFKEWSQQITDNIGKENRDKLVPGFSTTGTLETALHELALMDCMKSYFEYRCRTRCGISKVKLLGEAKDWENLRSMTEGLREYELGWWVDELIPVIDKIIACYNGEIDKIFWYTIYKQYSTSGSGASTYVNGWITVFFPYINDRKRRQFPDLEELRKDVGKSVRDYGHFGGGAPKGRIEIYDVPNNVSKTPFIWEYLGTEIPMCIYGGFPGCKMEDGYIRPVLAWAVGSNPKEEEKKEDPFWR